MPAPLIPAASPTAAYPRLMRCKLGPCYVFCLASACQPSSPQPKDPPPVAPTPPVEPIAPPQELLAWLDPDATLVLHWRPPAFEPQLLADLFAAPPALGFLYDDTQRRVQDTARLLPATGKGPQPWRALSFLRPGTWRSVTVLRLDDASFADLGKLVAQATYPVQQHHEWTCLSLPASYAHDLCILDAPDVAWVGKQSQGVDLWSLAQARDLPQSPSQRRFARSIQQEPSPSVVAHALAPFLHWELDQDPTQLEWTLTPYGRPGANGALGFRGLMRMAWTGPNSEQAQATLQKAALLQQDAPKAAKLRAKAHIAATSQHALEIRLEQHGDTPVRR